MKVIDWETPEKKRAAYRKLEKIFAVSTGYVSLSMRFKRDGEKPEKMRDTAIQELGGKLLDSDAGVPPAPKVVKVLNSKGETERVLTIK